MDDCAGCHSQTGFRVPILSIRSSGLDLLFRSYSAKNKWPLSLSKKMYCSPFMETENVKHVCQNVRGSYTDLVWSTTHHTYDARECVQSIQVYAWGSGIQVQIVFIVHTLQHYSLFFQM
jgi:hypothetical protein